MDFNTGRGSEGPSREPNDSSGSVFGSGQPNQPHPSSGPSAGGSGGEFNLSDPVNSFVRTVREILFNPVGFFRGLPHQSGFVNPLVFALICSVIAAVLGGILGVLLAIVGLAPQSVVSAIGSLFLSIILLPIGTAIGSFVGAGIYHLLVLLLVKPNSGFEATYRVVAYSSVIQLVSWLSAIPLLGLLVALAVSVFGIILGVLGVREMHATTTGKAALVVLIPVAVLLVLALLLGTVFILFLRSAGIA